MNIDWTTVISSASTVIVAGSITTWVYTVMKSQVDVLSKERERSDKLKDKQIEELEKKLLRVQIEKASWYRAAHRVQRIITTFNCKDSGCEVMEQYRKYQSEEGNTQDE